MKNTVKIVSLILVTAFVAAVFAGCFGKKALTADGFKKAAEENGLTVEDGSDIYSDAIFTNAQLAKSPDGWYIVFLTVDSAEHAEEYFNTCKDYMVDQKTGAGTAQTSYGQGYNIYWQVNGGRYMYAGQVGSTFLYADEAEDSRSGIEAFVKAIGY